jgi:hypothetical protein
MEIDSSDSFIREERRWEAAQQDRADRERARHREAWNTRIGYIASAAVAITVIVSIALGIWRWAASSKEAETSRINACSVSGGTWTTIGGGLDKMCIKVSMEVPR